MTDAQSDRGAALARQLLGLTARFGARADEDPFGNPVLLVALAVNVYAQRVRAGAGE